MSKNEDAELRFAELSLFDRLIRNKGYKIVAGVDEAGRGPLAGPVVAAACVLPIQNSFKEINDSKQLSPAKRLACFKALTTDPHVKYGIGIVSNEEIDRINIYQASLQAMLKAVSQLALSLELDYILVDGKVPISYKKIPSEAVIKGDAKSLAIAAASIIAKETRDRIMVELHAKHPKYGFDQHKGYGTTMHLNALRQHGPSAIHRFSFALPRKESEKET